MMRSILFQGDDGLLVAPSTISSMGLETTGSSSRRLGKFAQQSTNPGMPRRDPSTLARFRRFRCCPDRWPPRRRSARHCRRRSSPSRSRPAACAAPRRSTPEWSRRSRSASVLECVQQVSPSERCAVRGSMCSQSPLHKAMHRTEFGRGQGLQQFSGWRADAPLRSASSGTPVDQRRSWRVPPARG